MSGKRPRQARPGWRREATALLALLAAAGGARAAEDDQNAETSGQSGQTSIASSLPANGDPGGVRRALAERGVLYNLIYTGEALANVRGGKRRGGLYEGKLEINTTWDLEKAAGLKDLTFFANGFQIHRTAGISRDFVGSLQTISAIEALPTTRLSELWVERKFLDGTFGLRVGQLTADSEFFIASYSLPFINSDFPAITKINLPGGGPAYPLSTPGVRLRWDPTGDLALLGAVFNGNPARPNTDPERSNRYGVNFRVSDPALLWGEMQVKRNQAADSDGLAGILRVGAWTHLGKFDDQRLDARGGPLASSDGTGIPGRLKRNHGVYGIVDQQIYRPPGGDLNSGLTVFSRISGSPSDRNLIDFYLDGGIVSTGMIPGRSADKLGATFLYSHLSSEGRAFDRALGLPPKLRRDYELTLELTYVAEVRPGWTVQPDVQRVFHPGGRTPDAIADGRRDATILGLRTTVVY